MTWIRTVPLTEADEKLRRAVEAQKALYPKEYAAPVHPTPDGTSGIVASHSLIPDALYHAFATFAHAEFLRRITLDEKLIEALESDYTKAPISQQDRVMLDYVVQVTRDATRITPANHEALRRVGFDDRGILQITLIAAWFNYINRVADALGVGRAT